MSSVMICLVGEQPVPNLLPVRHCKPSSVVLAYSDTTKRVHDNLVKFFSQKHPELEVESINIPPYDLVEAYACFKRACSKYSQHSEQIWFNITGGTKPMSFAGFLAARDLGAQIVYLQSEGGRSILHFYEFRSGGELRRAGEAQEVGESITIEEYLQIHGIWEAKNNEPRDAFEQVVVTTLEPYVDEILKSVKIGSSLEIDLIIRRRNQIGVAEVKHKKSGEKKGIDQLNTATNQDYLGKYTKRFLIRNRELSADNQALAEASGIEVIVLPSFSDASLSLSQEDKVQLEERVLRGLGATPRSS